MFGFFKKKEPAKEPATVVAGLSVNDDALQQFKAKAQEQLPYLIEFMETHEEDDELFKYAVKTKFTEDEKAEHMWVQVTRFHDDFFTGQLANNPNTIKKLKHGDPVKVSRADVEDWLLQDLLTYTKVGGFSSGYIRDNAK